MNAFEDCIIYILAMLQLILMQKIIFQQLKCFAINVLLAKAILVLIENMNKHYWIMAIT